MVDATVPTSYGFGLGLSGSSYVGLANVKNPTKTEHERARAVRQAGMTSDGVTVPNMQSYWTSAHWNDLQLSGLDGVLYFPGHVNYTDASDSLAPYSPLWRRDLSSAFAWWVLDTFCDPVYNASIPTAGSSLVGFTMKAGTHTLRFVDGRTYYLENCFNLGYYGAASGGSLALNTFYISFFNNTLGTGAQPIWDTNTTTQPDNTHIMYPWISNYALSNLTVEAGTSVIERNTQNLPLEVEDYFYGTVTNGSNVITNAVMADEFLCTFSNSNYATNCHFSPVYPGAPDYPLSDWIGKQVIVTDLSVKGIDDGSTSGVMHPMPPAGGFTTGDGAKPVIHSIDGTDPNKIYFTTLRDWNNGQKLSGDVGSIDPAVILRTGVYANTGTNPAQPHNLLSVLRTDRTLGAMSDGATLIGQKAKTVCYIPVGTDATTETFLNGSVTAVNTSAKTVTLSGKVGGLCINASRGTFTDHKTWTSAETKPWVKNSGETSDFRRCSMVLARTYPRKVAADNTASPMLNLLSPGVAPFGTWAAGQQVVHDITWNNGTISGGNFPNTDNSYNNRQFWYNVGGFGAYNITFNNTSFIDASSDQVSLWPKDTSGTNVWRLLNVHWKFNNCTYGYAGRHMWVLHNICDLVVDGGYFGKADHWFVDNETVDGKMIDCTFKNFTAKNSQSGWVTGLPGSVADADFQRTYTGCTLTANSKFINTTSGEYILQNGAQVGAIITGQYIAPGTYIVWAKDFTTFEISQPPVLPPGTTTASNITLTVGIAPAFRNFRFENIDLDPASGNTFKYRLRWPIQLGQSEHRGTWAVKGTTIAVAGETPSLSWLGICPVGPGIPPYATTIIAGIGPATWPADISRYAPMDSRTVSDAFVTNGSPIVISATAAFVTANAGATVFLAGVAYKIISVQSGSQVTLTTNYTGTTGAGRQLIIYPYTPPNLAANEILVAFRAKSTQLVTKSLSFGQKYPTTTNPTENRFGILEYEVPWPGLYIIGTDSHGVQWNGASSGDGYADPMVNITMSRGWTEVNVHNNKVPSELRTNRLYNIGYINQTNLPAIPVIDPITHLVDQTKLPSINGQKVTVFATGNDWDNAGDDQVVASASSLSLTRSPSTSTTFGTSVTFTATWSSPAGGLTGHSIKFYDTISGSPVLIGTATTNSFGIATLATSSLVAGIHPIYAQFDGETLYQLSASSTLSHTVISPAAVQTALSISQNSSTTLYLQSVNFSVTLLAVSTPVVGKTIIFSNTSGSIGTAITNGSGVATLAISSLQPGSHSVFASFAGDSSYTTSTSTSVAHAVTINTTTSVNPGSLSIITGQTTIFTATVASSILVPDGSVTFKLEGNTVGQSVLSDGVATLPWTYSVGGSRSLTATYDGTSVFNTSTSSAAIVNVTELHYADNVSNVVPVSDDFGTSHL